MDILVYAVQNFLNHFIEYGFSQENEMRMLARKIGAQAHLLKQYIEPVATQAADIAKSTEEIPEVYKKLYLNPNLRAELQACKELFDAAMSMENRIYAPAEAQEQDDDSELYTAAALMFI
jgi:hypothetical protein